jgi:hypothetical protein
MHRARKIFFLGLILALSMLTASTMNSQTSTPAAPLASVGSPTPAAPSSAGASPAGAPESRSSQTPTYEDLSTISLAKSGLHLEATGAVVLGKADVEGCTRERLRLQWRVNDPIDIFLIRPLGAQKIPAVLFLYNYNFHEAVFEKDRWCNVATRNGYAVVGVPSALSWSRIRPPRPLKEWFVGDLQEALASSAHDVQMVINSLATRDDIDTRLVGIFGEGSGGAIAILAAAADPRIRVLDLMDPWGDWPDWLKGSLQIPEKERPDYLKPEFLAGVSTLDPVDYLPQLKDRSIHIQQVLTDLVTPSSARDRIAAAAPQPSAVARYDTVADESKALGSDGIVGWIAGQLHPSPLAGSSQQENAKPRLESLSK